jgi:hypothetical protein
MLDLEPSILLGIQAVQTSPIPNETKPQLWPNVALDMFLAAAKLSPS